MAKRVNIQGKYSKWKRRLPYEHRSDLTKWDRIHLATMKRTAKMSRWDNQYVVVKLRDFEEMIETLNGTDNRVAVETLDQHLVTLKKRNCKRFLCGREFYQRSNNQAFCCKTCQTLYWNARVNEERKLATKFRKQAVEEGHPGYIDVEEFKRQLEVILEEV